MELKEKDLFKLQRLGHGVPEIAFHYDLDPDEVVDHIEEVGAGGFDLDRRVPNEGLLERLYVERGWSGVDIAERFDCTRQAVYQKIHHADIETRDRGESQPSGPQDDRLTPGYISSKLAQGWTLREMEDDLDCSRRTITRWKAKWEDEGKIETLD